MTYATAETDLFALEAERSELTHVLMPNMAYACGGNIITKGGHFTFRSYWEDVTCPDCLGEGQESIRVRSCRQQDRCIECYGTVNKKRVCMDCGVAA